MFFISQKPFSDFGSSIYVIGRGNIAGKKWVTVTVQVLCKYIVSNDLSTADFKSVYKIIAIRRRFSYP